MDWAIKIGYAVMVFAIIMCFIFSKRGEKEMRHMVDRFAQAFCKLSNYVLPGGKAPAASLSTRKKDGVMQALPAAEQPEELQKLMKRGTARHLAELYGQMEEASAELVYRCRRHRRNRELFADPIRQICYLTSVFLEGCADPKTISDQNRINAFESFYTDQLKHRATLLKRIAGENAESFLELNMDYDLATVEKMELEAKKNRRKNEREAAARRKRDSGTERDQQTQEHPAKGLGGIYVQRLGGETALHPLAAIFLEHRVKALLLIHGSIPHFCCVWVECAVLHMTKV